MGSGAGGDSYKPGTFQVQSLAPLKLQQMSESSWLSVKQTSKPHCLGYMEGLWGGGSGTHLEKTEWALGGGTPSVDPDSVPCSWGTTEGRFGAR